jgi:single-stranded-DNA-specific exonuclease
MPVAIVRRSPDRSADNQPPSGIDPLLWQLYRARGVARALDCDRSLQRLLAPSGLRNIDAAAALLSASLQQGQRILVVGDFDADGATSCAVAVRALRAMGHERVDFLVPNRFEFGYGLTPEIVEVARPYNPQLLITVDNGISSVAGVSAAKALGWKVLVTDHHLAGSTLPDADVLVNPNLEGDDFASKALAGVGVIFYVMTALRSRLRQQGWFREKGIPEPNLGDLLDLVALGTVADVVPLDRNNRILVHQGLARIRAGRCQPGIAALLRVAGRDPAQVQAADMGFFAGPRLNAAGRLDDMTVGIRCLLTDDADEAARLADELDRLNRARRKIERDMRLQAEAMLADGTPEAGEELLWGLCLHHDDWHQGVIGILASRIKDKLHRPVIAFAAAGDGQLKGSARSIVGLHIRDALDLVAVRHPDLLSKFGGHAMAAGLSIQAHHLAPFRAAFETVCRERLSPAALQAEIRSDGPLAAEALTLETARLIGEGGPWGQGFEEPVFDGVFEVTQHRCVGEDHWKLTLQPLDSRRHFDAIAFNAVESTPEVPSRIHAAYQLDRNVWQGQARLQLRILHMQAASAVDR